MKYQSHQYLSRCILEQSTCRYRAIRCVRYTVPKLYEVRIRELQRQSHDIYMIGNVVSECVSLCVLLPNNLASSDLLSNSLIRMKTNQR